MVTHIFKTETNIREFLSQKGKIIFFVHNKKSVEQLAPFKKIINGGRCLIVPTSVEVLFDLDRLNLPYRIPEDYYAPEEIVKYTENLETEIMDWAGKIDDELEITYPEIKKSGLKIAFYNLYSFIRVRYPLIDAYFKIEKILQEEKPDRVCLMTGERKEHRTNSAFKGWLLREPDENIFFEVFSVYKTNLPIHLFAFGEPDISSKNIPFYISLKNKIKIWVKKRPNLYYFIKNFKKDRRLTAKIFFSRSKLMPLLLLNAGYNWEECHAELYKKGYYIWGETNDNLENWFCGNGKIVASSENILNKLENDIDFREAFREYNIDFYPILKDKITIFLREIVPASFKAYKRTMELIQKKKIKGVLFSVNPTAISKSIAYAATQNGVPVIGWQHGGDVDIKRLSVITFNDLLICDLFLNWGEGANENMRVAAKQLKLERKQKNIGSSSLDKLISAPAPDCPEILKKIGIKNIARPIIVYATTMYHLSNTYNGFYPPASDNYLYRTQKKIIERLALLGGNKIVKLHPNGFYALSVLDDYCNSFRKQGICAIRNEVTAPLLFSVADIIIIDQPSTTVPQALVYGKPTFCLTRHLRPSDRAEELLKKRVVLAKNPEALMEEVKLFIESGKYKADINNNEFLENFGTMPDGKAAERAVFAVDGLIKNFSAENKKICPKK